MEHFQELDSSLLWSKSHKEGRWNSVNWFLKYKPTAGARLSQFTHCLDTPRWIRSPPRSQWSLAGLYPAWQQLCQGTEHQRCSQAPSLPNTFILCASCKAHSASIHQTIRDNLDPCSNAPQQGCTQPQSNCTGCLSCYWAFFLSFPHKYFFTHIFGICDRRQNSSHAFKKPDKSNQY